MTPLASCSHSLQSMPVARAMRAAAANQIMMLAVNPLSSVCTNVHRDQYCTTRIEFLVILSFTHFYGRAAAELSFSDLVLRTFTGLMKTDISYNSLNLYLYEYFMYQVPLLGATFVTSFSFGTRCQVPRLAQVCFFVTAHTCTPLEGVRGVCVCV